MFQQPVKISCGKELRNSFGRMHSEQFLYSTTVVLEGQRAVMEEGTSTSEFRDCALCPFFTRITWKRTGERESFRVPRAPSWLVGRRS